MVLPKTIRVSASPYCICMSVEKRPLLVLFLILLISVMLPFIIVPLLFMLPLFWFVLVTAFLIVVWAFRMSKLRHKEEPENDG
jgi:Flp pilus assembly protein TadB